MQYVALVHMWMFYKAIIFQPIFSFPIFMHLRKRFYAQSRFQHEQLNEFLVQTQHFQERKEISFFNHQFKKLSSFAHVVHWEHSLKRHIQSKSTIKAKSIDPI